jgi:hypothetical protein
MLKRQRVLRPLLGRLACGIVLSALASASPGGAATGAAPRVRQEPLPEYKLKAAFLIQLFNFVRWPEGADTPPPRTSRIGLLGEDPFGDLFRNVEGTLVAGRPLEIKRFRTVREIEPCHILFVAGTESVRLKDVLEALGRSSTLTVGESPDFVRSGGMIRFYHKGDRIRLEMDAAAAERAGLKPSAKLLDLATRPEDAPPEPRP